MSRTSDTCPNSLTLDPAPHHQPSLWRYLLHTKLPCSRPTLVTRPCLVLKFQSYWRSLFRKPGLRVDDEVREGCLTKRKVAIGPRQVWSARILRTVQLFIRCRYPARANPAKSLWASRRATAPLWSRPECCRWDSSGGSCPWSSPPSTACSDHLYKD